MYAKAMSTPPSMDSPPPRPGYMSVVTPRCVLCGTTSTLDIPIEGFRRYHAGAYIQDAFPDLTADEREMLINGTHPLCLDKLAPPDDDE